MQKIPLYVNKLVIIGGTGTLGTELAKRLKGHSNIHIVSRGEHSQQEMKKEYPEFHYHICDIRDKSGLNQIIKKADTVFHFAALKSIDVCEQNPIESLKTNTLGTINIAELCIEHKVKRFIFSSTDKAVDPISSYGYAKAMSEKILHHYNKMQNDCSFFIFRWGNIINSKGSAIPFFIKQIYYDKKISLTNPNMTRFFMKIETAVDYMLDVLIKNKTNLDNHVFIPREIKSAKVTSVISCLDALMRKHHDSNPVKIIETGIRGCEKLDEQLISIHEQNKLNSKDVIMNDEELRCLLEPLIKM